MHFAPKDITNLQQSEDFTIDQIFLLCVRYFFLVMFIKLWLHSQFSRKLVSGNNPNMKSYL